MRRAWLGAIHIAATGPQGPWYIALDHAGVIEELTLQPATLPGPGIARFAFDQLGELYAVLSRVYQLSSSLPDAPLREFEQKVRSLPLTTEAERLVVQRIGQDIFRRSLMDYWQGRCPLTGISDPALLRASHIVPWRVCESDAQRLDVHNGLLLSALWDAAFDKGLVTFADNGRPMFSPSLSDAACGELRWNAAVQLGSGRAPVAFNAFADESEALERDPGKVDRLGRDLQPVHGSGVRQDHLDDADVDAQRHRPGPLVRSIAPVLDQLVAVEMSDLLLAEVAFQGCKGCLLAAAGWFPNGAHIGYMKINQVTERVQASDGRSIGPQPLIDQRLALMRPAVRVFAAEKRLARVAALSSDLDPGSHRRGAW